MFKEQRSRVRHVWWEEMGGEVRNGNERGGEKKREKEG